MKLVAQNRTKAPDKRLTVRSITNWTVSRSRYWGWEKKNTKTEKRGGRVGLRRSQIGGVSLIHTKTNLVLNARSLSRSRRHAPSLSVTAFPTDCPYENGEGRGHRYSAVAPGHVRKGEETHSSFDCFSGLDWIGTP